MPRGGFHGGHMGGFRGGMHGGGFHRGGFSPRRGGFSPRRGGFSPRRGGFGPSRGGFSPRRGGFNRGFGGFGYGGFGWGVPFLAVSLPLALGGLLGGMLAQPTINYVVDDVQSNYQPVRYYPLDNGQTLVVYTNPGDDGYTYTAQLQ